MFGLDDKGGEGFGVSVHSGVSAKYWSNCRSNRAHRLESSRKCHLNASVLGEPTTPDAYFLNVNAPNGRKERTGSIKRIPSCYSCWGVGGWSDSTGDGLGREEKGEDGTAGEGSGL